MLQEQEAIDQVLNGLQALIIKNMKSCAHAHGQWEPTAIYVDKMDDTISVMQANFIKLREIRDQFEEVVTNVIVRK